MPDDDRSRRQHYKIGDVSKILGISPDLIRYYEKKGIVLPHKDRENAYRYYEAWDVNFLIECLWYKQYGFGMNEIQKIVSDSSYEDLQELLRNKEEEIIAEINIKEMMLKRLHERINFMERARNELNVCALRNRPEFLRILDRHNYEYSVSETVQDTVRKWSGYYPFISRCFDISRSSLTDPQGDFSWGYSIPVTYAEALGVDTAPPVEHIVPSKCIHIVVRQEGKYGFAPAILSAVPAFARSHGYEITGHTMGVLVCSVREHGSMTGYFEAFTPVEKIS